MIDGYNLHLNCSNVQVQNVA